MVILELIYILLAAFLFLVAAFYWMYRTAENDRHRRKRAVKASAKIIKIGHSRNSQNEGDVIVYLTLEITPPGGTPYEVDTDWWLSAAAIPKVEVGRIVAVKIDAKNPRIIYSAEKWFTDSNH